MKRILLLGLSATAIVSCSNSSSTPPPPAGQDGNKLVQTQDVAFGTPNNGLIDIEKGKDLILAVGFQMYKDAKGDFLLTDLKTDLEKKIALIPKPISDQDQKEIDRVCFTSNTPHHWLLRHKGQDTELTSGQAARLEPGAMLYLAIETRSVPKCERLYYSFSAELPNPVSTQDPTPVPTPNPTPPPSLTPAIPAGSESVVLVRPNENANFNFSFARNDGRDFTYKISMLLDGAAFAKTEMVEKVLVNIFDKQSASYVSDWMEVATLNPAASLPSEYHLQFTFDKFSAPSFFIDRQIDMVLVFAINSATDGKLPFRSLEIGNYCFQQSRAFINTGTGTFGCK